MLFHIRIKTSHTAHLKAFSSAYVQRTSWLAPRISGHRASDQTCGADPDPRRRPTCRPAASLPTSFGPLPTRRSASLPSTVACRRAAVRRPYPRACPASVAVGPRFPDCTVGRPPIRIPRTLRSLRVLAATSPRNIEPLAGTCNRPMLR
ncbi:unnamed protein product [Aphis gossypii]|uniref:Uncharacterized protein n=1 Tax=Aphis gossypii TaxID=80765 RepID=A0A9P0IT38_APHGO|nr:unnamed protein product [Aphis gossypii]